VRQHVLRDEDAEDAQRDLLRDFLRLFRRRKLKLPGEDADVRPVKLDHGTRDRTAAAIFVRRLVVLVLVDGCYPILLLHVCLSQRFAPHRALLCFYSGEALCPSKSISVDATTR